MNKPLNTPKPVPVNAPASSSPSKPEKVVQPKPGKEAHLEALRVLQEAVARGDLKEGGDLVIAAFIKTVVHRLKPYAKVTYE